MVGRKRQNQPDIDICKRCGKEIIDRNRLGFGELWYCKPCQREIVRQKNHKIYRKYHPKKLSKRDIIIKRLKKQPATEKELIKLSKCKTPNALRATISILRSKGYSIQPIHFMGSHYVLTETKMITIKKMAELTELPEATIRANAVNLKNEGLLYGFKN